MTDREKAIRILEGNYKDFVLRHDGELLTVNKLIALLKEQEAIKPKLVGVNTWTCGECGTLLGWEDFSQSGLELISYKYCPGCGRKVKWDD